MTRQWVAWLYEDPIEAVLVHARDEDDAARAWHERTRARLEDGQRVLVVPVERGYVFVADADEGRLVPAYSFETEAA